MKKVLKVFSLIYVILVVLIVPFLVITLISEKTTLIPNLRSYSVLTGSMEPQIPVGSVVYSYVAPKYITGDVITFKKGEINVTHRIIKVTSENGEVAYQTKGDANKSVDPQLIPADSVIGKVYITIPYLGKFSAFLKTTLGFSLLIVLPIIIFILLELRAIKIEMEKEIEKKLLKKHHLNEA